VTEPTHEPAASASPPRARDLSFPLTLAGAFLLHFIVIRTWQNLAWPDEVFQTLEQGHRLAFGYGIVPWEFRDGVRSWVLPALMAGVMRTTAFLGSGSHGYLVGVHVSLALASLAPVAAAMAWARREGLKHAWLAGAACATWFELAYFSSKVLTEVFAAYAIAPALFFSAAAREGGRRRDALWAGACWGLTVGFRFHLAPAALVGLIWVGRKDLKRWAPMLAGGGAVLLAFGLVDWLSWSYPFQSFAKNFWINVVQKKASFFGESPWYEYLVSLAQTWSWGAVPLVGLAAIGARRRGLLWQVALAVFAVHTAIAHKEYRFLVPLLVVVVLAASLGLLELLQRSPRTGWAMAGVWLLASGYGAWMYDWRTLAPRPAKGLFPPSPMWTFREGTLRGFELLSTDAHVCGVAAVRLGWAWTGGFTYLHRDVPFFEISDAASFQRYAPSFNIIIAPDVGPQFGPYQKRRCWDWVCLYQREGGCVPPPGGYTINSWLKEHDM
jgi:GPI mannosyltransferase 3